MAQVPPYDTCHFCFLWLLNSIFNRHVFAYLYCSCFSHDYRFTNVPNISYHISIILAQIIAFWRNHGEGYLIIICVSSVLKTNSSVWFFALPKHSHAPFSVCSSVFDHYFQVPASFLQFDFVFVVYCSLSAWCLFEWRWREWRLFPRKSWKKQK